MLNQGKTILPITYVSWYDIRKDITAFYVIIHVKREPYVRLGILIKYRNIFETPTSQQLFILPISSLTFIISVLGGDGLRFW